jgi:hypothetical protein
MFRHFSCHPDDGSPCPCSRADQLRAVGRVRQSITLQSILLNSDNLLLLPSFLDGLTSLKYVGSQVPGSTCSHILMESFITWSIQFAILTSTMVFSKLIRCPALMRCSADATNLPRRNMCHACLAKPITFTWDAVYACHVSLFSTVVRSFWL